MLFGTADGQVIVMDCHGRMLAHVLLHESDGIVGMSWNCPDFLVEDSTESDTDSDDNAPSQGNSLPYYSDYKYIAFCSRVEQQKSILPSAVPLSEFKSLGCHNHLW